MNLEKEISKKVLRAIQTNQEYYNRRSLLGYQWAIFYIMLGAREAGKSFSVLDFCLKEFFTKGKSFFWLRLTEASMKKLLAHNAMQLIDIELMNKYNINSKDLSVKQNSVFYKGKLMAKVLALSTFYSDKGVALFDNKEMTELFNYNVILDEFQRERNEKNTFDISYAFVNQLENLVRHRTDCRIFLIGNTLEECSDILTLFNFIPETFGRYKLKKKRAVIDYMPPSEKYLKRRKGCIASLLTPEASNFTNSQKVDKTKLYKGRLTRPNYIIQFRNDKFTVWDGRIIARYKNEKKPVISMVPLLSDNSIFRTDLRDEVILKDFQKEFLFKDLMTQKLFDKCIKEIKGIKG